MRLKGYIGIYKPVSSEGTSFFSALKGKRAQFIFVLDKMQKDLPSKEPLCVACTVLNSDTSRRAPGTLEGRSFWFVYVRWAFCHYAPQWKLNGREAQDVDSVSADSGGYLNFQVLANYFPWFAFMLSTHRYLTSVPHPTLGNCQLSHSLALQRGNVQSYVCISHHPTVISWRFLRWSHQLLETARSSREQQGLDEGQAQRAPQNCLKLNILQECRK